MTTLFSLLVAHIMQRMGLVANSVMLVCEHIIWHFAAVVSLASSGLEDLSNGVTKFIP